MAPWDKIIVPGDLGVSFSIVSSIWSFGGNKYRSICDIWGGSIRDSESDNENETNIKINSAMGPVG